MAVEIEDTDRGELTDMDAGGESTEAPRSGVVVPIVHTSIDAEIMTEIGGHRLVISIDSFEVETPPIEHFVYYAGVAALVGIGLVELPIAVALGIGHALIDITHRPGLNALGEVLEEV
ncbi:MAG TPA: hypothetical protein VN636_18210 [Acidimicrobiia bacterium]|nr:hypothetical protein [Acidimicrobiia bacterium]